MIFKMKKLLLILLVLLVGCTVPQECPQIQCPVCRPNTVNQPTTQPPSDLVFVHFIDVGQGDATLIKSGETEMLVDCGRNGAGPVVTDYLKQQQVSQLEYLLITHPDSDHLGGCDDVLQSFSTNTVITNGQVAQTVSYQEVVDEIDTEQSIIANTNHQWNIGAARVKVLQANNGLSDSNQNSIVLKVTNQDTDILLTADCDRTCEDLLLEKDIASEILKVTHHGSKFGTEIDLLEKVQPQAGIISAGKENSYGHPAPETLDRLAQEGVLVYRTDIEADIVVKLNPTDFQVIP
jgi:competence protein ComEC